MNAKILIADDESDIVSMLGSFFESKGFRVLPASNGAEALKQVEKQPDIILLDINMPGTDGLEVCKRIRDHISCPILFLTARIEDTDKVSQRQFPNEGNRRHNGKAYFPYGKLCEQYEQS